jgi:hypothetical protein
MAYGAMVSGLLGAVEGAGKQADERMKQAAEKEKFDRELTAKEGSAKRMLDMEMETKDLYAQRVAERTKNQRGADMKTIDSATQSGVDDLKLSRVKNAMADAGVNASEMSVEAIKAFEANPQAFKDTLDSAKIKDTGLLNVSARDAADVRQRKSFEVNPDIAAHEQVLRKDTQTETRLDNQEKAADNRFEVQTAQIDRQIAASSAASLRAEKVSTNANDRMVVAQYNAKADAMLPELRAAYDRADPKKNQFAKPAELATAHEEALTIEKQRQAYINEGLKVLGVKSEEGDSKGKGISDMSKYERGSEKKVDPVKDEPRKGIADQLAAARKIIDNVDRKSGISLANARKLLDEFDPVVVSALRKKENL